MEPIHTVNTDFRETINLLPINFQVANASIWILRILRLLEKYGKDIERSLERLGKQPKTDQNSSPPQAGAPPVPIPPGASSPTYPASPPQPAPPPPPPPSASIIFARDQLQHAFRRAFQFGVQGTQNNKTLAQFEKALRAHIDAPGTVVRVGTLHKIPATHYVNPATGLNVVVDATGKFWSAWKLNPAQLTNVLQRGSL